MIYKEEILKYLNDLFSPNVITSKQDEGDLTNYFYLNGRKLKVCFRPDLEQELEITHGMNAKEEMKRVLREYIGLEMIAEIASKSEIDRQMLKMLIPEKSTIVPEFIVPDSTGNI